MQDSKGAPEGGLVHVNLLPALAQPEGAVLVCVKRSAGDAIADTFTNAKQLKHQALVHRPLSFVPLVPVPAGIDYLSGTQEAPDAEFYYMPRNLSTRRSCTVS